MTLADPSLAREFEAALAWWRAAGVDCDFTDDATAWLAEAPLDAPPLAADRGERNERTTTGAGHDRTQDAPSVRSAIQQHSPTLAAARRDLLGDSPPGDLAAFREWWLTATALDTGRSFPRIAPRGDVGAALMVLVPQPEEEDRDTLLEGPQGRLLANILAAMGLSGDETYIASALPCHTPMADLAAIGTSGMDAVLAHHIALARPQRILALGTGLQTMLAISGDHSLREINHGAGKVPLMISETLEAMMEMPQLKARFWKRWVEWSAE
jgi:DNA polymerase